MVVMAAMDETTLSTLDLLEARLLRIEHLLCGQSLSPALAQDLSAVDKIAQLERRFSALVKQFRVYGEILKICMTSNTWLYARDVLTR